MIYLAVDYGSYEGWRLEEVKDVDAALVKVKGSYSGCSGWKILREIEIGEKDRSKIDDLLK